MSFDLHGFGEPGLIALMGTSSLVVFVGPGPGLVALRQQVARARGAGRAGKGACRRCGRVLRDRFYVDELYGVTVIAFYEWWAALPTGLTAACGAEWWPAVAWLFRGWAQLNRLLDV